MSRRSSLLFGLALGLSTAALASIQWLEPEEKARRLAVAQLLFERKDVTGLAKLLEKEHLSVSREVALMLGRLGADEALPVLRKMDEQLSRFLCAPSGQFGVAVILIENKTEAKRKEALLRVASQKPGRHAGEEGVHVWSVVDCAGRELSRHEGEDVIQTLKDAYTNGAQYTVLSLQCKGLPEAKAIAKCIAVLEAHETPMTAGAAEEVLIEFGANAKPAVEALIKRVEERITPDDPAHTIPKSIRSRCRQILRDIGE